MPSSYSVSSSTRYNDRFQNRRYGKDNKSVRYVRNFRSRSESTQSVESFYHTTPNSLDSVDRYASSDRYAPSRLNNSKKREYSFDRNVSSYHAYNYDKRPKTSYLERRHPQFSDLPLEWWERAEDCKDAKSLHMTMIDSLGDRENLVLQTTLYKKDTVLESNMFPYLTPKGIEHYTLWSRREMKHEQVVEFVDKWLLQNMSHVRRWQYDDNSGQRSIELFHVHVYIETVPFSFTPAPENIYYPPHVLPPESSCKSPPR